MPTTKKHKSEYCIKVLPDGKRCRAWSLPDSKYCYLHDNPDNAVNCGRKGANSRARSRHYENHQDRMRETASVITKCANCGKEFGIWPFEFERRKNCKRNRYGDFCSRECFDFYKRVKHYPRERCEWCGGYFRKYLNMLKKQKRRTCSAKCSGALRQHVGRVRIKCERCGKWFSREKSVVINRRSENYYCSMECQYPFMQPKIRDGGYVAYRIPGHPLASRGGEVFEHRLVVWQESGYSPTILKRLQNGDTVHHRNGIKDDNRPENLELKVGTHTKGISLDDMIVILSAAGYEIQAPLPHI